MFLEEKFPLEKLTIEALRLDLEQPPSTQRVEMPTGSASNEVLKEKESDAQKSMRSTASTAGDSIDETTEEGVLKHLDYLNMKGLLVEVKEYHKMVDELLMFLKGLKEEEPPVPPAPVKKKTITAKGNADKPQQVSKDKEEDKEENVRPTVRCEKLRETVDPKSRLQDFKVLDLKDEHNLSEMLHFLGDYMMFTAKMAHYLFYIGDMVE